MNYKELQDFISGINLYLEAFFFLVLGILEYIIRLAPGNLFNNGNRRQTKPM